MDLNNYFATTLLKWYTTHKRDLPWRHTKNPYLIWLSEIMLQQTRVAQGLPYYQKFISLYPTIQLLANSSEEEILKHWQGLGYYSRARNLHATAKYISYHMDGMFPKTYQQLLDLKGIGAYTAAAIASFAFNEPVAVLDGNVIRVLSRYTGFDKDVRNGENQKELQNLANALLDKKQAGLYNQAIMEFGALQCTPIKPNCPNCPLQATCQANKDGNQNSLPYKSKSKPLKNRYFNYLVLEVPDKGFLVRQRLSKDVWFHLYEFYNLESRSNNLLPNQIMEHLSTLGYQTENYTVGQCHGPFVQKLSHQKIHAIFIRIVLNILPKDFVEKHNFIVLPPENLHTIGKPLVVQQFIDTYIYNPLNQQTYVS